MLKKRKQGKSKNGKKCYEVIGKAEYVKSGNSEIVSERIHKAFKAEPWNFSLHENAQITYRAQKILLKKIRPYKKFEHKTAKFKECVVKIREEGNLVEILTVQPKMTVKGEIIGVTTLIEPFHLNLESGKKGGVLHVKKAKTKT